MVVFIDLLIFENIIVNYFIMFITAQTLRINLSIKYGVLASVMGSLYIFTVLIPKLYFLSVLPIKIAFPFLMIIVAFRKRNLLFNIKASIIYVLYSMLIAGMCYSLENCNGIDYNNKASGNISYKKLLIAIMIIYLLINRIVIYVKDRKEIKELIYPVDIFINGDKKSVNAFFDTGNELREPATNLPVLIVEKQVFSDINLDKKDKYYIPYNVLDGGIGKLVGFMPDYITIEILGEIRKKKVVIGCCENKLNKMKDYDALLSRGII